MVQTMYTYLRWVRQARLKQAPGIERDRGGGKMPNQDPNEVFRKKMETGPHGPSSITAAATRKPKLFFGAIGIAIIILIPCFCGLTGWLSYQSAQAKCAPLLNDGRTVSATVTGLKLGISEYEVATIMVDY